MIIFIVVGVLIHLAYNIYDLIKKINMSYSVIVPLIRVLSELFLVYYLLFALV